MKLRLYFKLFAKAVEQESMFGGLLSKIKNNPNLQRVERVDRTGRKQTRYVRRAKPASVNPYSAPRRPVMPRTQEQLSMFGAPKPPRSTVAEQVSMFDAAPPKLPAAASKPETVTKPATPPEAPPENTASSLCLNDDELNTLRQRVQENLPDIKISVRRQSNHRVQLRPVRKEGKREWTPGEMRRVHAFVLANGLDDHTGRYGRMNADDIRRGSIMEHDGLDYLLRMHPDKFADPQLGEPAKPKSAAEQYGANYDALRAEVEKRSGLERPSADDATLLRVYATNVIKVDSGARKIGDTVIRDGRTYRLNENYRWEQVDDEPKSVTEAVAPKSAETPLSFEERVKRLEPYMQDGPQNVRGVGPNVRDAKHLREMGNVKNGDFLLEQAERWVGLKKDPDRTGEAEAQPERAKPQTQVATAPEPEPTPTAPELSSAPDDSKPPYAHPVGQRVKVFDYGKRGHVFGTVVARGRYTTETTDGPVSLMNLKDAKTVTTYHNIYAVKLDSGRILKQESEKALEPTDQPKDETIVQDPKVDKTHYAIGDLQRVLADARRDVPRYTKGVAEAKTLKQRQLRQKKLDSAQEIIKEVEPALDEWAKRYPEEAAKYDLNGTKGPSAPMPTPAAATAPVAAQGGAEMSLNAERNGVELKFPGKPDAGTLASLKASGFRWSGRQKLWYARQNPKTMALAQSLAGGAVPEGEAVTPAEPAPVAPQKTEGERTAESLRAKADAMESRLKELNRPAFEGMNITARRAGFQEAKEADARAATELQGAMRKLADAHEAGTLPESLKGVTTKTLLEKMMYAVRYLERQKPGGTQRTAESFFTTPKISTPDLRELLEKAKGKRGLGHARAALEGHVYDKDQVEVVGTHQVAQLEKLVKGVGMPRYSTLERTLPEYKRLLAAGFERPHQFAQAVNDLKTLLGDRPQGDSAEQKIKKAERELIGLKLPGFFPTPKPVIQKMLDEADIKPGMSVLEPSAGKGDIADALKEAGHTPSVVEMSHRLQNILKLKGHNVVGDDALEHTGQYQRILANPPFENGQDAEHLMHAYTHQLAPGGRLVFITSEGPFFRSDKKASAFREWLESVGGHSEKLPEGSFKGAGSFNQTGVNTRLVVVDKPEVAAKAGQPRPLHLRIRA